ncbi:MAG: 50S ribosomal protein L9 [Actinomycetota bacterium]|nr:50S ribosomal protein L9 [Actinomycetota bacterium]
MKLILTREVAGLGAAGDVVNVKDGFARNYLLPRGNAIAWSQGGEKQIQSIRRARSTREIRDIDHAKEVKATIEAATITTKVKVGAKGVLFGSVTDKDVASAIKAAIGLDVDRHLITTKGHIKTIGSHTVKIALGHNVVASATVNVVAE